MCRSAEAAATPPPFPWRAIAILLACNLTEPIVMAVLFPMAPFMVGDWVARDEVGTWAGTLTSAYNLASVPSGIFWGRLSDRWGRRPCMGILLMGSACSMVIFGCSGSLLHALLARCLGGLFSGMGGLVTAGMRDLTTEEQRSTAVASISWAYGVGFAIGPLLGGMLVRPAERFPALRGTIFETFPYLAPCLVVAYLILLSGLGLLWLPMPLPRTKLAEPGAPSAGSTAGGASAADAEAPAEPKCDGAPAAAAAGPPAAVELSSAVELPTVPLDAAESDGKRLLSSSPPTAGSTSGGGSCWAACVRSGCQPVVLLLLAYLLLNFGSVGAMEGFPLLLTRNDTSGLGLAPLELGQVMLPQSVVIFVMPCVYPRLASRFGHKGCFYVGIVALLLFCLMVPLLRLLRDAKRRPLMWTGLLCLNALRGVTGPLVFPAVIIIVNQAITERVGFWNGTMSSVAAGARAAAPSLFGHLFSVGTRAGHLPFPLNVHMPFLLAIVSLLLSSLLVWSTPITEAEASEMRRRRRRRRFC
jgi:MFS family permease